MVELNRETKLFQCYRSILTAGKLQSLQNMNPLYQQNWTILTLSKLTYELCSPTHT